MNKLRMTTMMLGAITAAGCSGGETANNVVDEPAAVLQPGEYEITGRVVSLRSTDKTQPATDFKEGSAAAVVKACVGPENDIDPAAFVEAGDDCTPGETYMRNGRMSLQLQCTRSGKGRVSSRVDGNFQEDGFSGDVITTTYFSGPGDYQLTRSITAKRVGECTKEAG